MNTFRRFSHWPWRLISMLHLSVQPHGFFTRLHRLDWYRQTLNDWIDWLAPPNGARLMDVGCSGGSFSLALAQRGFHVTAMDRSTRAIRYAQRRAGSVDVKFLVADALQIPQPALPYDYTLAASLLNVVPDPHALLTAMARVTANEGIVSCLFPTPSMQRHTVMQFIHTRRLRGFSAAAALLWADFAKKLDIHSVTDMFTLAGLSDVQYTLLLGDLVGVVRGTRHK